jgi:hypothetical protein
MDELRKLSLVEQNDIEQCEGGASFHAQAVPTLIRFDPDPPPAISSNALEDVRAGTD